MRKVTATVGCENKYETVNSKFDSLNSSLDRLFGDMKASKLFEMEDHIAGGFEASEYFVAGC